MGWGIWLNPRGSPLATYFLEPPKNFRSVASWENKVYWSNKPSFCPLNMPSNCGQSRGVEMVESKNPMASYFPCVRHFFIMPYLGWYFGCFESGAIGSMFSMLFIYDLISGAFEGKPSELKTGSATNNRYHLWTNRSFLVFPFTNRKVPSFLVSP